MPTLIRGKGLHRSTPHKIRHRLGAELHPQIAAALAAGPKGSADLRHLFPPVFDQSQTETCAEHSFSALCVAAMASAGTPLPFIPSMVSLASTTYADLRAAETLPGQPLPKLVDTGAELQDVANSAAKWGVGPMMGNLDGRLSDVPNGQENDFPEPSPGELQLSAPHVAGGEYAAAIDSTLPLIVAASLDCGIPLWTGGLVGQAYQQLGPNDVADPTPASDTTAGGHAQGIAGYRIMNGEIQPLIRNSWGPGWSDGGYCWGGGPWLLACWDVWPFPVKVLT